MLLVRSQLARYDLFLTEVVTPQKVVRERYRRWYRRDYVLLAQHTPPDEILTAHHSSFAAQRPCEYYRRHSCRELHSSTIIGSGHFQGWPTPVRWSALWPSANECATVLWPSANECATVRFALYRL